MKRKGRVQFAGGFSTVAALLFALSVSGICYAAPAYQGKAACDSNGACRIQDFGAKCDGKSDDSAAIQSALDAVSHRGSGSVVFMAGTCKVPKTVKERSLTDASLIGAGTVLAGGDAAILELGGEKLSNVSITGLKVTNGAWADGKFSEGQSAADGIRLLGCRLCNVDVTGENVGGSVLFFGATAPATGNWSTLRVRAFDVGRALDLYRTTTNMAEVVVRRSHLNAVRAADSAQLTLNVSSDETLLPPHPSATDGVGVQLIDADWCVVRGSVGIAAREALRIAGNSQWNTITGAYYDSSTSGEAATSNIIIERGASQNMPMHNILQVYAGFSGKASKNRPAYGVFQREGRENTVPALDASGTASGGVKGDGITGPAVPHQ